MAENEIKNLKRVDLLELLIRQSGEIDRLNAEVKRLQRELDNKEIKIRQAGSIAQAALELNGVFSAAQNACEQYIENIKSANERQDEICAEMLRQTGEKCEKMVLQAQNAANACWQDAKKRIQQALRETEELCEILLD